MAATHYCQYCRYYATDPLTGEVDYSKDFTGTRTQVVRHARVHPIGHPEDFPVETNPEDTR